MNKIVRNIHHHEQHALPVGAGGVGLRATLSMAIKGLPVACATKIYPTRGHTVAAHGGVTANLGIVGEDDWRWDAHGAVKNFDRFGDWDAIEYMARKRRRRCLNLSPMGFLFPALEKALNARRRQAALPLQAMEFGQFHPSGVNDCGCLFTEGARAEGGYLTNAAGERFVECYAPNNKNLAPRDVDSRAMSLELAQHRGAGAKSDHAGELGAVAIYDASVTLSRGSEMLAFAAEHRDTERRQLEIIERLVCSPLRSRILPLWREAAWCVLVKDSHAAVGLARKI